MPKGTALHDSVEVDDVDLSNLARAVVFASEHERIDVSGFSVSGANEYLAGTTDQTLTITFYGSYGTGEVHATLYPIHQNRELVMVKWRADQTAAVSATNPELRGMALLLTYGSPNRTRGEAETFEAQFSPGDEDGFQFYAAALP